MKNKIYVKSNDIAPCMVCGLKTELRFGVCYPCSSKVSGHPTVNGQKLWETVNPEMCGIALIDPINNPKTTTETIAWKQKCYIM